MPKPWKYTEFSPGLHSIKLNSWNEFPEFMTDEFLDYKTYVYRGHRKASWRLVSTLARHFEIKKPINIGKATNVHLEKFKLATRGRRGSNPQELKLENEWWALGQHYGLFTPLLDWSTSPYVAAYFAFQESEHDDEEYRAIFAVAKAITAFNSNIKISHEAGKIAGPPPIVEFISPHSNENGRLVNQGGLFSRLPLDMDLESWIPKYRTDPDTDKMDLIKILIPNTDREICLRTLNRMNINHLTLFPDLEGASISSNMELQINKY